MKGIIDKTKEGWVIRKYDGKKPAFKEILLHPEDAYKMKKEVSFLIVKKGDIEYAKLVKPSIISWIINKLKWVSNK